MIEKIEKLLKSGNFEDIYLGLSLLNSLEVKEQRKYLRRYWRSGRSSNSHRQNFSYKRDAGTVISTLPTTYDSAYIVGKYYAFVIRHTFIMADSPYIFRKYTQRRRDKWTILENWKENEK